MGFSENLVKYILFIVNLFVALAGLALLGAGVAVELKVTNVIDFLQQNHLRSAPISAMVLGGVVFVIAFFGCCGAVKESNCMLVTYSIFMLVLIILKITIVVLLCVKWKSILAAILHWLQMAFNADRKAFHEFERTFSCCGPTGPKSYEVLPPTCCGPKYTNCTYFYAYSGCDDLLIIIFYLYRKMFIWVAIVGIAVELVVMVFAMCLANHVRNRSRGLHY